jgi:hypothetical protein
MDTNDATLEQRLITAVIDGGDDVRTARAMGMACAAASNLDVISAARAATLNRLGELYDTLAVDSCRAVANNFDSAASKFSAAAKQFDPDADAGAIVGQPDEVRTGWMDAATRAAEIDQLQPVLVAAADLAGVRIPHRDANTVLLPLVVDTDGLHRRPVWEAWRANGSRCGHWSTLAALGAVIHAWPADRLDSFEAYRVPLPAQRKQFQLHGPGNRGMYRVEILDPEDEGAPQ